MKKICPVILLTLALVFALQPFAQAQSSNPRQTLDQYISDLQRSPNDNTLREKIIRHVQTMRPTPAIPEEARRHFVMARTLENKVKDAKKYELAISEYREALLIAPWWPEAYNNMGILLEQAGQYDEATRALKLYVLTNPKDAREAQDKIYAVDAAKKLAVVEETAKSTVPSIERPKSDLDVSGQWIYSPENKWAYCNPVVHFEFCLDGDNLVNKRVYDSNIGPWECGFGELTRHYRGERVQDCCILHKTGKDTFECTDDVLQYFKIEFINDKVFWTFRRYGGQPIIDVLIRK